MKNGTWDGEAGDLDGRKFVTAKSLLGVIAVLVEPDRVRSRVAFNKPGKVVDATLTEFWTEDQLKGTDEPIIREVTITGASAKSFADDDEGDGLVARACSIRPYQTTDYGKQFDFGRLDPAIYELVADYVSNRDSADWLGEDDNPPF